MPLDPRIPLSAVGIQTQSPFEALQPVLQARAAQQQLEVGDAQLAAHRAALEQAGRARQRQAQIDAALEAATIIDPETGRPRVDPSKLVGHLPASLLPEVMKQIDADMKSGQEVQTGALTLDDLKKKHVVSAAQTVVAANYDPDIFRIQVRVAQKLHAIDNETASEYLAIDDPAQIKQLVDNIIKNSRPPTTPVAVQTTDEQGNNVTRFVPPEAGTSYPNQPPKEEVVPVQTVDEHGRSVTKMVPKKAGEVYPNQPDKGEVVAIQTVDEKGNPVTKFVTKTPGATYPGSPKDTTPKLSAPQQEDLATMMTVEQLTREATTLGTEIGWSGVGPFEGRVGGTLFGWGGPKGETLRNKLGNIQGTIAKLRGGTSFTPNEQALLESYTPTTTDTEEKIKAKLISLAAFIKAKRENTLRVARGEYTLPPEAPAAPQPGERRMFNGQLAEWQTIDGQSGWAPVQGR